MAETLLALFTTLVCVQVASWQTALRNLAPLAIAARAISFPLTALVFLGGAPLPLLAILLLAAILVEIARRYKRDKPDSLQSFAIGEVTCLAFVSGLSFMFPQAFAEGRWPRVGAFGVQVYCGALCLLSGVLVNLTVGSELIRRTTAPFTEAIGSEMDGLPEGGAYIGLLERALVMLLIFINQAAGIGFLVTAKSILRFGDVKDSTSRKHTEYIIIGTFMSFGWGILTSTVTLAAIRHWLP